MNLQTLVFSTEDLLLNIFVDFLEYDRITYRLINKTLNTLFRPVDLINELHSYAKSKNGFLLSDVVSLLSLTPNKVKQYKHLVKHGGPYFKYKIFSNHVFNRVIRDHGGLKGLICRRNSRLDKISQRLHRKTKLMRCLVQLGIDFDVSNDVQRRYLDYGNRRITLQQTLKALTDNKADIHIYNAIRSALISPTNPLP